MASFDLGFYMSVLWRRLPLLVAVAAVPAVGGLAIALLSPPVYRATALVMVVSPRIPAEMARSTVSDSAVGRFHIIERELTTPPSLLTMAERFGLDDELSGMTPAKAAEHLRSRLDVEQFWLEPGTPAAPAFSISFEAGDPAVAATVANDLATRIIQEDKSRRVSDAAATLEFFRQDVDRLSTDLALVEEKVMAFRTDHIDALPDSLDYRRNQQSGQAERLLLLEREEAALRSRRFNLSLMFETTGRVPGTAVATPEGQVLAELRTALASQQALYTDDSPGIVALKARIARMEASAAPSGPPDEVRRPSTEMDIQLAEIDGQLRSIAAEKDRIAMEAADLAASIAVTPENETGLSVLLRERENLQGQYNAAVARLAQASTGEQVENDLKGERLVLLEGASVPQGPVRPKRVVTVLGGIGLGFGAAAGLMVLLELLNRRVRRPADLQRTLGMEPLVTLPYMTTPGEIAARRAAIVFTAGLFTVALSVAIVLTARPGLPFLDSLGITMAEPGSVAR